ncbi:unnamed protein product, partial [Rotaria magnacalcarata]
LMAEKIGRRGL